MARRRDREPKPGWPWNDPDASSGTPRHRGRVRRGWLRFLTSPANEVQGSGPWSSEPSAGAVETPKISKIPPAEVARRRRWARRQPTEGATGAVEHGTGLEAPTAEAPRRRGWIEDLEIPGDRTAPEAPATEAPLAEEPATEVMTPAAASAFEGDVGPETESVPAETPVVFEPVAAEVAPTEPVAVPVASAAAAGAGLAGLAAVGASGVGGAGWRRWLGTKQVAAVVLLLLAAEVGYVVHLNVSSDSSKHSATPPLSTLPSTTVPVSSTPSIVIPPVPATTAPPKTAPGAGTTSTTTTTPRASTAASSTPLGYCTTGDLDFSTTTNASSYSPGDTVHMTMTVTDIHSCIFQPVASGAYDCPTVLVVSQGGEVVFPGGSSGVSSEGCSPPPAQDMNPGSSESVSAGWPIPSTWSDSAGNFTAVGEWHWSAGSGQTANTINIASNPFTIS